MSKEYWNRKAVDYNNYALSWHWLTVGYLPVLSTLKEHCKGLKNIQILDFGCGNGRIGQIYKKYYHANVTGVDLSEKMIEEAKYKDPSSVYSILNAEYKILLDTEFDCAMANWVLIEVNSLEIMIKELKEIYKRLKPGGIFVALVNNDDFIGEKSQTWQNGIKSKKYSSGDKIISSFFCEDNKRIDFQNYFWTDDDYSSAFRSSGFKNVKSFVPEYNSSKNIEEIKYLQNKNFFPDVNYRIPATEKPTKLITGIKELK